MSATAASGSGRVLLVVTVSACVIFEIVVKGVVVLGAIRLSIDFCTEILVHIDIGALLVVWIHLYIFHLGLDMDLGGSVFDLLFFL